MIFRSLIIFLYAALSGSTLLQPCDVITEQLCNETTQISQNFTFYENVSFPYFSTRVCQALEDDCAYTYIYA